MNADSTQYDPAETADPEGPPLDPAPSGNLTSAGPGSDPAEYAGKPLTSVQYDEEPAVGDIPRAAGHDYPAPVLPEVDDLDDLRAPDPVNPLELAQDDEGGLPELTLAERTGKLIDAIDEALPSANPDIKQELSIAIGHLTDARQRLARAGL